MLKRFLVLAAFVASFVGQAFAGQAFASVDVNSADESALRGIKGIGPSKAKAILYERASNGPFRDAADLAQRVKGLGGHTLARLQAEGLAIGSTSVPGPGAPADAARSAPSAQKNSASVAIRN
ncbi:MAG TPA: helix-hairpin-helix domain-containing protein [Trinickia sp.]|jgi:competence protein ComEA|nr:helix-hairpin-helix domain-containing protein [Trinickia sp.]